MAEIKQVSFTIDGKTVTAPAGTLVIEAAKQQGIEVPSFCYYPGFSLQAACRMCLVEVEKMPKLQTACTLVAMDGMAVKTDTAQVHTAEQGQPGKPVLLKPEAGTRPRRPRAVGASSAAVVAHPWLPGLAQEEETDAPQGER